MSNADETQAPLCNTRATATILDAAEMQAKILDTEQPVEDQRSPEFNAWADSWVAAQDAACDAYPKLLAVLRAVLEPENGWLKNPHPFVRVGTSACRDCFYEESTLVHSAAVREAVAVLAGATNDAK